MTGDAKGLKDQLNPCYYTSLTKYLASNNRQQATSTKDDSLPVWPFLRSKGSGLPLLLPGVHPAQRVWSSKEEIRWTVPVLGHRILPPSCLTRSVRKIYNNQMPKQLPLL